MSNVYKTLPNLPSLDYDNSPRSRRQGQLARLTVESRAHQRKFIKHALSEEAVDSVEEWLIGIEFALQELAENIAREGWLSSLRSSRKACNAKCRAKDAEQQELERKNYAIKLESKEGKLKGKFKDEKLVTANENKEGTGTSESSALTVATVKEQTARSLNKLREAVSVDNVSLSDTATKRMLLTLSPEGAMIPTEDTNFDYMSSKRLCIFTPGSYSIPSSNTTEEWGPSILYGFEEWDGETTEEITFVGGVFTFRGIRSVKEYLSLAIILRLSIFMRLNIVLEQELLSDSKVHLNFSAILSQPMTFSYTTAVDNPVIETIPLRTPKTSISSGLWSFLTKKTGNILNRASRSVGLPISAVEYKRSGSLDFSSSSSSLSRRSSLDQWVQSTPRERRSSFSLYSRPSLGKEKPLPKVIEENTTYAAAVKQIASWADLLSTSPGIKFSPPKLLDAMAEKEKDSQRRPTSEEKLAMNSLLGWEGRRIGARGMSGLIGFTRHQAITLLYTKYIHDANKERSSSDTDKPALDEASGKRKMYKCGRSRWITYRYFSRSHRAEQTSEYNDCNLGGFIERLCCDELARCSKVDCDISEYAHERVWIHNGVRISCNVSYGESTGDFNDIRMWESCSVCGESTSQVEMSDSTYLISFAKYLELLLYSPYLCRLSTELCEHTNPSVSPSFGALPTSRFNIARHFATGSRIMNINLSQIPVVYELHLPPLHVLRSVENDLSVSRETREIGADVYENAKDGDEEKRILRREMKAWWQVLAEHIDKLENLFLHPNSASYHKSLPRLPSSNSCYNSSDEDPITPKAHLPSLPPSTPGSPSHEPSETLSRISIDCATSNSKFSGSTEPSDVSILLSNLRHVLQQDEQSLYALLSNTSLSNLNYVRRTFSSTARGAAIRLSLWQTKHAPDNKALKNELSGALEVVEPEWWKSNCHTIPGGSVVVREAEWGSIISFTLSSFEYRRELSNPKKNKGNSAKNSSEHGVSDISVVTTPKSTPSSFTSGAFKAFRSAPSAPDPDSEGHVWYTLETCSTNIIRQERDPAGMFAPSRFVPSRFVGMATTPGGRSVSLGTPPSAWAKPAVELNTKAVDGKVSGLPDLVDTAEKLLQEKMDLSADSYVGGAQLSSSLDSTYSSSEAGTPTGRPPSLLSLKSDILSKDFATLRGRSPVPSRVPSKTFIGTANSNLSTDTLPSSTISSRQSSAERGSKNMDGLPDDLLKPIEGSSTSSFSEHESSVKHITDLWADTAHGQQLSSTTATSLTSTLTHAMRYLLSTVETPRPSSPAHHHKLLAAADASAIDSRPHIKYEWTVGKRLKFSCTVYYAKEFDLLRKRYGVEDIMLKSLERSENWSADGGKSRSNFWKTTDERFVIKTLVNAWNVADLQVLIDIAPSYFRYVDSTAYKPSLIAKLLGFYTIEVKNLESGNTQAKADLLVMENLFYGHKVSKTYDLKGIQGRKVKNNTSSLNRRTLFDSEWIEEQQKMPTLIRPHSKLLLNEAIKADADYLSRSNIMDYSLLLGIDEEKGRIACGLVDTIGSYTFAKTLEYKAKHNLNSGKEVTVIPPNEYQRRFINAIDSYFLACPDKWSRPQDDSYRDHQTLPSVL